MVKWKQLNKERIPDDDLERSKHVGCFFFNKKVLNDFSVT